jgi:thiosulfate dehydrogenase (quinone) large subunit
MSLSPPQAVALQPPAHARVAAAARGDAHTRVPRTRHGALANFLALARISLGGVFLWAFLDKLFGFGYATPAARAWVNGGSPTRGYLGSSTGPFAGFFQAIAGHPVTDALFMMGLLGVGLALVAGVGMRAAAVSGALMMALMWLSHPPWIKVNGAGGPNPLLDDHVVYAFVLLALAAAHAGRALGAGAWWTSQAIVRRHRWLE